MIKIKKSKIKRAMAKNNQVWSPNKEVLGHKIQTWAESYIYKNIS